MPGFRESWKSHSDPTCNLNTNDTSTYLLRMNLVPIFQVHRLVSTTNFENATGFCHIIIGLRMLGKNHALTKSREEYQEI